MIVVGGQILEVALPFSIVGFLAGVGCGVCSISLPIVVVSAVSAIVFDAGAWGTGGRAS